MERLKAEMNHAVFGAFDGVTVLLGIVIGLYSDHPNLILGTAISVGVAEAIGMAAAEWLSESESGYLGPTIIGASVALASVLPALPFFFLTPWPALWVSASAYCLVAALIAYARKRERGLSRSLLESYGILALVSLVVWLVS